MAHYFAQQGYAVLVPNYRVRNMAEDALCVLAGAGQCQTRMRLTSITWLCSGIRWGHADDAGGDR